MMLYHDRNDDPDLCMDTCHQETIGAVACHREAGHDGRHAALHEGENRVVTWDRAGERLATVTSTSLSSVVLEHVHRLDQGLQAGGSK